MLTRDAADGRMWIGGLVAAATMLLAGIANVPLLGQEVARSEGQRTEVARRMYSGEMLPDEAVKAFAHADELFAVRVVRHGAKVRELPAAAKRLRNVRFTSAGKTYDLFDYLALNRVAGILVLKDGRVALEEYELGIGPQTRWPSFSVAKSVTSTLVGAALLDGAIHSLDDRRDEVCAGAARRRV